MFHPYNGPTPLIKALLELKHYIYKWISIGLCTPFVKNSRVLNCIDSEISYVTFWQNTVVSFRKFRRQENVISER